MLLAARLLHEHGHAELLELGAHLGDVVDVGVLYREGAAARRDELVVGGSVEPAVRDVPVLESLGEVRGGAVGGAHGRDRDGVERPDGLNEADHAGRDQVDVVERQADEGDVVREPLGRLPPRWGEEQPVAARHADEQEPVVERVHREVRGVREPHLIGDAQVAPEVEVAEGGALGFGAALGLARPVGRGRAPGEPPCGEKCAGQEGAARDGGVHGGSVPA